jgi:hypothetical protein
LNQVLEIATKIGNPPQLWKTYQVLGELYERKGESEQARSAYRSAIEVIEEVASRLQDQELKQDLSVSTSRAGDPGKSAKPEGGLTCLLHFLGKNVVDKRLIGKPFFCRRFLHPLQNLGV